MAGVNVKMGVTGVSDFKRNMKDAQSSVDALKSALELNEKQLQATGNKESYVANQTQILKDAIAAQTKVVQEAEAALAAMRNNGVSETSAAFNNMKKKVYDSEKKLIDLNTQLKNVETQSADTSTGLENIGKNVAWDNIAEGIGRITDRLQSAARAAINFGKRIAGTVTDSTQWADNLKTAADQWDISTEQLQRMQNVAEIIDTDVDAILTAQSRMQKAATTKGGKNAIEEVLGISLNGQSADDLFWEIGDALVNMGDSFDKEAAAQQIFGRSWRELMPLFKAGREEYTKMLDEQKVMSDEDVTRLGQLDDTINSLKQQIELMKNQFIADNADKITELLQWIVDNKDGVVAALTAIGGGFAALKLAELAANVAKVVSGFQSLGMVTEGAGGQALFGGATSLMTGLGTLLDKFTPLALAVAAGNAFNPENTEAGKAVEVLDNALNSGTMSPDDVQKAVLMHDFGVESIEEMEKALEKSGTSGGHGFEIPIAPKAEESAAEDLAEQIGTVTLPANLVVTDMPETTGSSGGRGFANGISFVPYDGFHAVLHKGERVVPAREVAASRNFSSNLYVESMYMNNGTDAAGLAAAMSAAQRRMLAGYGS